MGTPFVIAMRNGEDLYRWIFSPYDGNIQSVGRMLFDHYDTREKVERLLDNGDIDLLAPTVEECEPLSERSPYYSGGQGSKDELPMFGELHTYIWRDGYGWGLQTYAVGGCNALESVAGCGEPLGLTARLCYSGHVHIF